MVERVVGCKWSLTVVDLVQRGVRRPGAMERTVEGLTLQRHFQIFPFFELF